MNKKLGGFSVFLTFFFNFLADFSGRTLHSSHIRVPIFAFVTRRRVYTVLVIFLLTFFYQLPASSSLNHKEGVLHNNAFEHQCSSKHSKDDAPVIFGLPVTSGWDPLTFKLRAYKPVFISQLSDIQILRFYCNTHRSRDDLLKRC